MLKTLEEPPANTVLLLLSDRVHAVLPTILSRCQVLRFGYLPADIIRNEMGKRYAIDPSDPRLDMVSGTGSLGTAMFLYENPVENLTAIVKLWNSSVKKDWPLVTGVIDQLADLDDPGQLERMFLQLFHILRESYLSEIPGTEKKYFKSNGDYSLELGENRTPDSLEKVLRICDDTISAVRRRGNTALVLANFALSVMEIGNG
jgi:DNA polymerase III subunit delta'